MNCPTALKDETLIIASCLEYGDECATQAVEALPQAAIFQPDVADVFNVIRELVASGRHVDSYTVGGLYQQQYLGRPLPMELLSEQAISSANLSAHVEAVVEAWRKRKVIEACQSVVNDAAGAGATSGELVARLERIVYDDDRREFSTLNGVEAGDRMIADLERRYKLGSELSGIPTGFYDLDRVLDGLQPAEQTVIGARPSMGKTAMGLGICINAAYQKQIPALYVSLEMGIEAIMRRLCASFTQVSMGDLRRGSYSDEQFKKFTTFRAAAAKAPFWVTDAVSGISVSQLSAVIRRCQRRHGIRLVVIDYLQKIRPSRHEEKRTYEVAEVSSALRALAVSSGLAVVMLAQLNRESERDKKPRAPRLSDLGDSKQIEQDADTVLLIHRDRTAENGESSIIIAKQRDGEIGMVPLRFNGRLARFENPARFADNDVPEQRTPYND